MAATLPLRVRSAGWLTPGASLLLAATIALLTLYAVFYLRFAGQLIAFPFDVDQGESYDAWSAWLIDRGQLPYTDNLSPPYYSSNYPPLWSYLVSIPFAWLGPALGPARAVSVLSTLGAAAVLGMAASRLATSRFAGLLAAGFFLASPYVVHSTPLARVNATALLFALLGLWFVQRADRTGAILGAVAFLGALFTKQTTADAVAAGALFLILARPRQAMTKVIERESGGLGTWGPGGLGARPPGPQKKTPLPLPPVGAWGWGLNVMERLGLATIAATVLLGTAGLVGLNVATRGAFWLNVVQGNANPFDWAQLASYMSNFVQLHLPLLVLAVVELVRVLRRGSPLSPWAIYLPLSILAAGTAGKWGAGESYFLGAVAAACVLASVAAIRLLRHGVPAQLTRVPEKGALMCRLLRLGRGSWLIAGLLLAQTLLLAHGPLSDFVPWLPDRGFQATLLGRPPTAADLAAGETIAAAIRRTTGPVLSEDAGFQLATGRPVTGNATHLRNLHQAGLWDPSPLVAEIEARRYAIVILNAQLYPEPVLAAIGRSYYLARSVEMNGFTYQLFLPGSL